MEAKREKKKRTRKSGEGKERMPGEGGRHMRRMLKKGEGLVPENEE
jgi:hypothetical protein